MFLTHPQTGGRERAGGLRGWDFSTARPPSLHDAQGMRDGSVPVCRSALISCVSFPWPFQF